MIDSDLREKIKEAFDLDIIMNPGRKLPIQRPPGTDE